MKSWKVQRLTISPRQHMLLHRLLGKLRVRLARLWLWQLQLWLCWWSGFVGEAESILEKHLAKQLHKVGKIVKRPRYPSHFFFIFYFPYILFLFFFSFSFLFLFLFILLPSLFIIHPSPYPSTSPGLSRSPPNSTTQRCRWPPPRCASAISIALTLPLMSSALTPPPALPLTGSHRPPPPTSPDYPAHLPSPHRHRQAATPNLPR
jgi:hypothetical protein